MNRTRYAGVAILVLGCVFILSGGVVMSTASESDTGIIGLGMVLLGCALSGTGASLIAHPNDWR